ncbi:MAG: hypothetical protein QXK98_06360 [Candidatus Bathyarchaeia archaeon]
MYSIYKIKPSGEFLEVEKAPFSDPYWRRFFENVFPVIISRDYFYVIIKVNIPD